MARFRRRSCILLVVTAAVHPFPIIDGHGAMRRWIARWRDQMAAPGWATCAWPDLSGLLHLLHAQLPDSEWAALRRWLRSTEIAAVMQEDPLTLAAWDRPRGLPMDPVLQDLMVGHRSQRPRLAASTPLGRELHAAIHAGPSAQLMRERLRFFTQMIANLVTEQPGATVLSLGAGHLRSHELLGPGERPAHWLALEPDARAAPRLRSLPGVHGAVAGHARLNRSSGSFDMICIPSLVDVLPAPQAARLTRRAFRLLKPGGRLVFGAADRLLPDAAYRDVFMDWPQRPVGPATLRQLLDAAPAAELAGARLIRRGRGLGAFGVIQRRAG